MHEAPEPPIVARWLWTQSLGFSSACLSWGCSEQAGRLCCLQLSPKPIRGGKSYPCTHPQRAQGLQVLANRGHCQVSKVRGAGGQTLHSPAECEGTGLRLLCCSCHGPPCSNHLPPLLQACIWILGVQAQVGNVLQQSPGLGTSSTLGQ